MPRRSVAKNSKRCTAYYLYNQCTSIHCPLEFKNIITDEYIFQPYLQYSMKKNSELLLKHLRETLCLSQEEMIPNNEEENILGIRDTDRVASDSEILNYVMQVDLPIILSIDASLQNECAISSVSLIVPNIHPNDRDMEWQHRPAKLLLTRAWKLPKKWGTGQVY
jgi:hypothetical protein